jgi:hypothetical protein
MKRGFWNVAGIMNKDKEEWVYLRTFDVFGRVDGKCIR